MSDILGDGIEKYLSDRKKDPNADFCIIHKNEKDFYHQRDGACHSGLMEDGLSNRRSERVYVISGLQRKSDRGCSKKSQQLRYIEYLLNESPYSSVFYSDDPEEVMSQEYFICYADVPSNLLASALVCTRHLWEKPYIIHMFNHLVNQGCNPDMAFMIASMLTYCTIKKKYHVHVKYSSENHKPFDPGAMTFGCLKNYLDHNPMNLNDLYSEDITYYGMDLLWMNKVADRRRNYRNETLAFKEENEKDLVSRFLQNKYIYGELPDDSMKHNIFLPAVSKSTTNGGVNWDEAELAAEKLAKTLIPEIQERVDNL